MRLPCCQQQYHCPRRQARFALSAQQADHSFLICAMCLGCHIMKSIYFSSQTTVALGMSSGFMLKNQHPYFRSFSRCIVPAPSRSGKQDLIQVLYQDGLPQVFDH